MRLRDEKTADENRGWSFSFSRLSTAYWHALSIPGSVSVAMPNFTLHRIPDGHRIAASTLRTFQFWTLATPLPRFHRAWVGCISPCLELRRAPLILHAGSPYFGAGFLTRNRGFSRHHRSAVPSSCGSICTVAGLFETPLHRSNFAPHHVPLSPSGSPIAPSTYIMLCCLPTCDCKTWLVYAGS